MGELANYSIETDQLIWLAFKDGQSFRVPVNLLPKYLTPHDLQKVHRAMHLRRDFFRKNMPTALVLLLVLGVVAVLAAGGQVIALLSTRHITPVHPAPQAPQIVRSLTPASPAPSPAPSPASTTTALLARHHVTTTAERVVPIPTLPPAMSSAVSNTAAVLVTPIATPSVDPTPTPLPSPTPAPTPSSSPTPTPGQVLGDATGPAVDPQVVK